MCNKISIPSFHGSPFKRFLDEFDEFELLGKGAHGQVYKARQKLVNQYYAVKIVRHKP